MDQAQTADCKQQRYTMATKWRRILVRAWAAWNSEIHEERPQQNIPKNKPKHNVEAPPPRWFGTCIPAQYTIVSSKRYITRTP